MVKEAINKYFVRRRQRRSEAQSLAQISSLPCRADSLRALTQQDLPAIFNSSAADAGWSVAESELKQVCRIEDGTTGGVNPGDRRAVWYLIQRLGPKSVLEIGTHVGASTVHIASALKSNRQTSVTGGGNLVTVDLEDVNNQETGAWTRYGLPTSPRGMVQAIGCYELVTFVTESSLNFFDRCQARFDFIFLDGDHSATTVYQELPRALQTLNENGVILLHDYFPNNQPIWSNGSVIPGPYLGTNRLRREGALIKVIPLGALPWPTKLGSNVTSLAVVTRR